MRFDEHDVDFCLRTFARSMAADYQNMNTARNYKLYGAHTGLHTQQMQRRGVQAWREPTTKPRAVSSRGPVPRASILPDVFCSLIRSLSVEKPRECDISTLLHIHSVT